jgi:hypothetical protein
MSRPRVGRTLTDEERGSLYHLASNLRLVATPGGPQHAYWDLIRDIEAYLQEERMILPRTAVELLDAGMQALAARSPSSPSA